MTNWKELILDEMEWHGETWASVVSSTISDEELVEEFNNRWGGYNGIAFTVWTEKRVYFPVRYDGQQSCGSASRNPDGKPTEHIEG